MPNCNTSRLQLCGAIEKPMRHFAANATNYRTHNLDGFYNCGAPEDYVLFLVACSNCGVCAFYRHQCAITNHSSHGM
jgi:hypothetical protein